MTVSFCVQNMHGCKHAKRLACLHICSRLRLSTAGYTGFSKSISACEGNSTIGAGLRKPVVAFAPVPGSGRKPEGELHDVRVVFWKIPVNDGFVVGKTVPERPDSRHWRGKILAPEAFSIFPSCNAVQCFLPEHFVTW